MRRDNHRQDNKRYIVVYEKCYYSEETFVLACIAETRVTFKGKNKFTGSIIVVRDTRTNGCMSRNDVTVPVILIDRSEYWNNL